ncbi:N-acetylmuramoyl-L-alanine amidase [Paenibacillus sp. GCM10012307]|uniref:N-acetylmuramoyl-L-alanine amidase n=1 Tax=Paenibacillus roseus TaxID=2798579 RepID=A0A934J5N7_9BACL|nr:N-acetylmuramoyl-L-alanine amidase [Paenibacillus roseus]MBJ6363330.1 N-acetylmuramoyl-L-alanine amidase [Paenibacillus roseus]
MKIAIDAGHGPETAGKRTPDGSLREFQFNRAVAAYVRSGLENYEAVEILFVHAEDGSRDVPLKERTDRANAWGASAYISIHANANGSDWNQAEGIETFVHTRPSPEALKLAEAVQRQLIRQTARRDRGVKTADFHVLRETKMPSILVECGFMTNREEAELLKSDGYRRQCASAIIAGTVGVYGLKPKPGGGTGVSGFKDVPQDHWAAGAIKKAADTGIIKGISNEEFGLGQPVAREQLAVILDRLGLLEEKK